MKKVILLFGGLLILAGAASWGALSKLEHHDRNVYTLTTSATTNLSVRTDTIWLNRNVTPLDGGPAVTLNLRDYTGFRIRAVIGPMAPADTASSILKHNAGVVDTISFVIKKRLGSIISLVDSSAQTVARLRSAADTRTISWLIGSGATDTLACDDLFGILRVADSTSDTAGVLVRYPVTTEAYFKK